jgi:hypothetical protein
MFKGKSIRHPCQGAHAKEGCGEDRPPQAAMKLSRSSTFDTLYNIIPQPGSVRFNHNVAPEISITITARP